MPELDAEHRNQMAEALASVRATGEKVVPEHGCGGDLNACVTECPVPYVIQMPPEEVADALAPLVAGWLADARADGWDARDKARPQYLGPDDGHYPDCVGWSDCYCSTYPNPYRGGDDG